MVELSIQRGHRTALAITLAVIMAASSCTAKEGDSSLSTVSAAPDVGAGASLEARAMVAFDMELIEPLWCEVTRTKLYDISGDEHTSTLWEFADGSTSTKRAPKIDGRIEGPVTLTISDGLESASVIVGVNAPEC